MNPVTFKISHYYPQEQFNAKEMLPDILHPVCVFISILRQVCSFKTKAFVPYKDIYSVTTYLREIVHK